MAAPETARAPRTRYTPGNENRVRCAGCGERRACAGLNHVHAFAAFPRSAIGRISFDPEG